jgi:hypothetical protein
MTAADTRASAAVDVLGVHQRRSPRSKRIECYSEFSAAIMRFINVGYRLAASIGLPTAVEPLDPDEGLPALANAEADPTLLT